MNDEWGRDPNVRAMREIFGLMESFQDGFLKKLRIDRYDSRLRVWRNKAKRDFEKAWAEAARNRIQLSGEQIAALYLRCLGAAMHSEGIAIPNDALAPSGGASHVERDR